MHTYKRNLVILQFILLLSLFGCTRESSTSSGNNNNSPAGKNVYVAGMDVVGQNFVATYWKNGVKTQLSNNYSYTFDIFVSGNDVYVVGFEGLNTHYPVLWKNGVKTQLSSLPGEAVSVFVSGSDVYVCGLEYLSNTNSGTGVGFLWKNGTKTQFSTGSSASCVFVSGYDVFVAGSSLRGSTTVASYWKNGALGDNLPTTHSNANAIHVTGTELYMVGKDFVTDLPVLWRRTFGGVSNVMTKTPLSTNTSTYVTSVYVSGADTYISGKEGGACYWKNGVRTQLSSNRETTAADVFVSGGDFYIAGRGENITAGYWKNGKRVEVSSTLGSYAEAIFVN